MQNLLQNTLNALGDWEQYPLLHLILTLLASIVFAYMVRFLLNGVVSRLASKTVTELDDHLVDTFNRPIVVGIVTYGLYYGIMHAYPNLGQWQVPIRGVMLTAVTAVWMVAFLRYGHFMVDYALDKDHYPMVQPRTKPLFGILIKAIVILGAAYFVILAWNLNVTGWLASAGVVGIAVGFAAKDTLANLISGIFIIADAPYKIGDYVIMDDGLRGQITDIGIRSTRMITRDDVEVIVPNAVMGNTRIVNQSGGPYEAFRLRVAVGVAYGSDIDLVRELLEKVAKAEDDVLEDPFPRVRMRAFGESSLDFELLAWVEYPELRGIVLDRLLCDTYKIFAKHNVEIPYPKRDVYLHQVGGEEEPTETHQAAE